MIYIYTYNLKFHGQCYSNVRIVCDLTTPKFCLIAINTAHKMGFRLIFKLSSTSIMSVFDLYVNVSFFSMASFWPSYRTLMIRETGLAFV